MVRAAGLYPAGSRFESWLPYHRRPLGSARRVADVFEDPLSSTFGEAALRRQSGDPRCELGRRQDGAVRRPGERGSGPDDRGISLDDEVCVVVGEPATDALRIASGPLQRALDDDPPAARPELPAPLADAGHGGGR